MLSFIPSDLHYLSQPVLQEIRQDDRPPERSLLLADQPIERSTNLVLEEHFISPVFSLQTYTQTQLSIAESEAIVDGELLDLTPVPGIADTPTDLPQQPEFSAPEFTPVEHEFIPITSTSAASQLGLEVSSQLNRSRFTQIGQSSPISNPITATSSLLEAIKTSDLASEGLSSSYKKPPRVIPDQKVNPFITGVRLNGSMLSHLTQWEIATAYNFGSSISSNLNVNGIYKLDGRITQSLSRNNVFASEQTGTYLQVQTVRTQRELTILRKVPQTLQGIELQLTFLGPCSGINDTAQLCSLSPSLITDKTSLDPKFLFPTRIFQPGTVGEAVSPETLSILSQPGFQLGGHGKQVGVDLYFPNIGALPGNAQTDETSVIRHESIETTPVTTISRIRQIIKANHNRAVLGRTIRGFPLIPNDQNQGVNLAVQLAAEVLPDVEPNLEGTLEAASTNINKNLFLAANNVRLPGNSFTIYQAGLGSAVHPHQQDQQLILPSASFNSVWLGLSPVTTFSQREDLLYQPTSKERVLVTAGGEGGRGSNNAFSSTVNNQTFSSAELANFYTQIYITFFNRDVNFVTETKITEITKYYPHLSLSGNITSSDAIFRYYGGVIAANSPKFYIGADYTKFLKTWTFNLEGVLYNRSDQDYYSHISGAVSKNFPISSNSNLILSSAFNYAFGRDETQLGISPVNFVTIGARANWGPISLGVTKFLQVLPHSLDSLLTADIGIQLGQRGRLSAFWSPGRVSNTYGVLAQYRFGDGYNSPTISLSWNRESYSLGVDQFDRPLSGQNNVFLVLFRFGAPAQPFSLNTNN
ncbi:hypothetical protein [Pantanalinema sp. GBBB05]|uniref:hypothetical protein n=1 Tax=Pantanalinema sp. GBBB05 TaxID=2604139 RepID=UPI001DB46D73|nr:hypothetical protein [Pantanalinema sp. GBBB05]